VAYFEELFGPNSFPGETEYDHEKVVKTAHKKAEVKLSL
jgi:hypothetical protein